MRAMWMGMAAAVLIAIGVGVIMTNVNPTAGDKYSTSNVRL
ncbi:MAG: hypothetical protein ACPGOV_13260 [Magnetovibrionaceae bacterium]